MKTIKQLARQPLKTLSGIVLMTLAVAILCVSVGQALAVRTTEEALNQQFSTVAIPQSIKAVSETMISLSVAVEDELLSWLNQTASENPDIVKQVSHHGILSAYIPELTPLNITTESYITDTFTQGVAGYYYYQAEPYAIPYSCAMLVITLEEVGEPEEQASWHDYEPDRLSFEDFANYQDYKEYLATGVQSAKGTTGYTVKLTGTVTDVISLQEGYWNPTGRTARLTLTVPTLEQIEALDLVPGEQYVVYGMDYVDEYWKLISELSLDENYDWVDFESFDSSDLEILTEQEREKYQHYSNFFGASESESVYARFFGILLKKRQYEMVNTISMTLNMPISLITYDEIRDDEGYLQEIMPSQAVSYTDANGQIITLSNEEYIRRYQIPTITRLEGSIDEFLSSAEGVLWQAALERDKINNQAFAVIGVDNMAYLADFSLQKSKIVEGRDFTAEELLSGEKVCIMYEALAQANGITVGDTITASFYNTDQGLPYQQIRSNMKGALNPSASFYFETTPFTEAAEYTVVGICRGERTFPNVEENEYEFSANTVYVPKTSVRTPMETYNSVPLVTVAIHNGKLDTFRKLAQVADYADCFKYHDQGYSIIAHNFHNYRELAKQIIIIGVTIYTLIASLFVFLYTICQRKNACIMKSLGAGNIRLFWHTFTARTVMVLPATLLGSLLGSLLWDLVADMLQKSAESAVLLQIEPWVLLSVSAVQLPLVTILNGLASAILIATSKKP